MKSLPIAVFLVLGMAAQAQAAEQSATMHVPDGGSQLAGIDLIVDHAPGHTRGSVTFRLPPGAEEGAIFTGDLLFAGSIGRTDLPGGSYPRMLESLARVVLPLPDEVLVLPGHGPATTIGAERAANPFLAEAAAGSAGQVPAPGRGL